MENTNLDVSKIKQFMANRGMGPDDVAHKMGVYGGMIRGFLNTGEAPPDLAARMAAAMGKTITEISTP